MMTSLPRGPQRRADVPQHFPVLWHFVVGVENQDGIERPRSSSGHSATTYRIGAAGLQPVTLGSSRAASGSSKAHPSEYARAVMSFDPHRLQIGGGSRLPRAGTVFVSVRDVDKVRILPTMRLLTDLGFTVMATSGTHRYFFRLFAIDTNTLDLAAGATRQQVEDALARHTLQTAELMGRYKKA